LQLNLLLEFEQSNNYNSEQLHVIEFTCNCFKCIICSQQVCRRYHYDRLICSAIDVSRSMNCAGPSSSTEIMCLFCKVMCVRTCALSSGYAISTRAMGTSSSSLSTRSNYGDGFDKHGFRTEGDDRGQHRLHMAAARNQADLVRSLVSDGGTDVNIICKSIQRSTALTRAVQRKSMDAIKCLLELKADVNLRSEFGHRPLSFAIRNSDIQCAELLLQHGASINAFDGSSSPLHSFLSMLYLGQNDHEMLEWLMDSGADLFALLESYLPVDIAPLRYVNLLEKAMKLARIEF